MTKPQTLSFLEMNALLGNIAEDSLFNILPLSNPETIQKGSPYVIKSDFETFEDTAVLARSVYPYVSTKKSPNKGKSYHR